MFLTWEHLAPECTMGRRHTGTSSVMLWAIIFWENIAVFTDRCGLFQQNNVIFQKVEWFEEYNNKFEVLTSPNSPDLNPIEYPMGCAEQTGPHLEAYRT